MADLDQAGNAQAGHNPTVDSREGRNESDPQVPEPPTPVYARDLLALFHKNSPRTYTGPVIDFPEFLHNGGIPVEHRDGTKDDVPIPVLLEHSSSDDQPDPWDEQLASSTLDELEAILSNTYCHNCVLEVPHRALDRIPPEYLFLTFTPPDGRPRDPRTLVVKCPDPACKLGRKNKKLCLLCVHRICNVNFEG